MNTRPTGPMDEGRIDRALALLFLERSRALLRNRWGRALSASIAVVYGIIALFVGGMVTLFAAPYTTVAAQLIVPDYSSAWWDYPAILITAPGGVVTLPFLPTLTMVIVSVGVGIGMAVGIVLTLRLRTAQRSGAGGAAVSSAAGFTPALIALVTLGACCSTTAAATAGIGAIAQASGTGLNQLLFNNWYLDLFQVGVLWVALLAQEQLIAIYGGLVGDARATGPVAAPVRFDRRAASSAGLRVALLAAGVVWGISAAAAWTSFYPVPLTAGLVFAIVLQHLVPAGAALAVGLFAAGGLTWLVRHERDMAGWVLRAVLLVSGLSVATFDPPPLPGAGVYGLGNEMLGAIGAPTAFGAVTPPSLTISVLLLRWVFEFALLGGFSIAIAVAPVRCARWLTPAPASGAVAQATPGTRVVGDAPSASLEGRATDPTPE